MGRPKKKQEETSIDAFVEFIRNNRIPFHTINFKESDYTLEEQERIRIALQIPSQKQVVIKEEIEADEEIEEHPNIDISYEMHYGIPEISPITHADREQHNKMKFSPKTKKRFGFF